MPAEALEVRQYREPSPELLAEWAEAAAETTTLAPFAHPAFAYHLPLALGHADRCDLWVARDQTRVRAVVPLARRRQRVGGVPLVQLESLASWHASITELQGDSDAIGDILAALTRTPGWHLLEWRAVRPHTALVSAARHHGLRIDRDEPTHVLALDAVDPLMSSGRARELRRLLRRDAERAGTALRFVLPADPAWRQVGERFAALHAARWARTPTPSPLADPGRAARFVDWLDAHAPDAGIEAVVLASRAGMLGVLYLATAGRDVHAWRLAYEPSARSIGPGMQLLQHAAIAARARGLAHLHFGRGTQNYKTAWHTRLEERLRLRWYRSSTTTRVLEQLGRALGRDWAAQWRIDP